MYVIVLFFILLFVFNSCITVVFPEDAGESDRYIKGRFLVHADKLKNKFELSDSRNILYRLVGLSHSQKDELSYKDGRWITARIEVISRPSSHIRNAKLIRIY